MTESDAEVRNKLTVPTSSSCGSEVVEEAFLEGYQSVGRLS